MMRGSALAALVSALALVGGMAGVAMAVPVHATASPCTSSTDCLGHFGLSTGKEMPYYGTYPLSGDDTVTQAVIVVHGTDRNASAYFDRMVTAAQDAGAVDDTEIVAPHFQTADDSPASDEPSWTNGADTSWKDGGNAVSDDQESSFAVLDEIVNRLADKSTFPKITKITVTGHSAGGQFTQRYAVGGRAPAQHPDITFHYVPMNPSSYLYFSSYRPDADGLPDSCPDFNNYKYGMDNRNAYMSGSAAQLVAQYTSRQVTYTLGGDDNTDSHGMDTSCSGMAEGPNRLARGQAYFAYIQKNYPAAPHNEVIVPGVGHDSGAMFDAPQGRAVLFGDTPPPPTTTTTTTTTTSPGGTSVNDYVTFYGYTDNNPPGTAITHPCIHQGGAGGTGTYDDPVTYAQGGTDGPWCEIIYVPFLKKYFIHEDSECGDSCTSDSAHHVDLWMGGDSDSTQDPEQSALLNCEDQWTQDSTAVELDPPSNEPVDSTPLFTPPTTCHGGQGD